MKFFWLLYGWQNFKDLVKAYLWSFAVYAGFFVLLFLVILLNALNERVGSTIGLLLQDIIRFIWWLSLPAQAFLRPFNWFYYNVGSEACYLSKFTALLVILGLFAWLLKKLPFRRTGWILAFLVGLLVMAFPCVLLLQVISQYVSFNVDELSLPGAGNL